MSAIHGGAAAIGKPLSQGAARGRRGRQVGARHGGLSALSPARRAIAASTIERFDKAFGETWRARGACDARLPELELIPTADACWPSRPTIAPMKVREDHPAIGLDVPGARRGVPKNARGYGGIVAAINRIATPENDVARPAGENWFRVLDGDDGPDPSASRSRLIVGGISDE